MRFLDAAAPPPKPRRARQLTDPTIRRRVPEQRSRPLGPGTPEQEAVVANLQRLASKHYIEDLAALTIPERWTVFGAILTHRPDRERISS